MRLPNTNYVATAAIASLLAVANSAHAVESADISRGDRMIAAYFRGETRKLADASLANIKTWSDWTMRREAYRQQLREMLGLDPLPPRSPLNAAITGTLERDDFKVERLHFQSCPQLYVTGNLYLPINHAGRAPAILYVCGHSTSKKNGVSFGNKTKYHHHGAWFARNGYVCLVIDTLQLGEIEGIHHGTYRENMWWWNARGYTPAGVEAWNSIRAIDYLVSRPEVDPERIGMTGRSGGGAYSWNAAALDDRIQVVVPVAGITNLHNHVVDGCVEGHCDCMYMVNTYRWDYPQLAALAAPRPLLISNTDRDKIFPFEGVVDVYQKVRRLYELDRKGGEVALQMAAGPHEDLQVLQLYALQWFNQHLKGESPVIETAAKSYFKPEELKVFDELPADQINSRVHETFVPLATAPSPPASPAEWESQRERWLKAIREKCFGGWPLESNEHKAKPTPYAVKTPRVAGSSVTRFEYVSQDNIVLPLYIVEPTGVAKSKLTGIVLQPLGADDWTKFMTGNLLVNDKNEKVARAFVAPRGIGPTQWTSDRKKQIHIRRRFMLLGQTLDGMRVWDVRRAIQTLRSIDGLAEVPLTLAADREMAGVTLYAALFEPRIQELELNQLARSHREGPSFLNVLRFLDMPQAVAMVAENSRIVLHQDGEAGWEYPLAVAKNLGWNDQIKIRPASVESKAAISESIR